jgi:hypothetical protein
MQISSDRASRCWRIICLCLGGCAFILIGVATVTGVSAMPGIVPSPAEQGGTRRPLAAIVAGAIMRDSARADPRASPDPSPAGSTVPTPTAPYAGDDHEANGESQAMYFLVRAVSLSSFAILVGIGLLAAQRRRARHERPGDE